MKKIPFAKDFFIFVLCDFTSKVWSWKALDFSLDSDGKPDENNIYTHASLQIENLPSSFTICTAFMVEAWAEYTDAKLFVLLGDNGEVWNWVKIFVKRLTHNSHSDFSIHHNFQTRAKSCFTHSSGPGLAFPRTQTLPWQGWLWTVSC